MADLSRAARRASFSISSTAKASKRSCSFLALREKAGVSQGVFARVLNAKPKLVSE